MNIIIKGRKQYRVPEDLQLYIEEKFRKFEPMVKEPTTLEIMLADVRGPQKGLDKVVHLTAVLPGRKNPEQIEELATGFQEAVDLVHERFKKFLRRWKEKSKVGSRYPKKYYLTKEIEKEEGEI